MSGRTSSREQADLDVGGAAQSRIAGAIGCSTSYGHSRKSAGSMVELVDGSSTAAGAG